MTKGRKKLAQVVQLERLLRLQHQAKLYFKGRLVVKRPVLLSAHQIATQFNLPQNYVRVYAWKHGLDPFPELKQLNNMWMAAYMVVYLGYDLEQAYKATGFRPRSIKNYLYSHGWNRYAVWGRKSCVNKQQRPLVIPVKLARTFSLKYGRFGVEDLLKDTDKPMLRAKLNRFALGDDGSIAEYTEPVYKRRAAAKESSDGTEA